MTKVAIKGLWAQFVHCGVSYYFNVRSLAQSKCHCGACAHRQKLPCVEVLVFHLKIMQAADELRIHIVEEASHLLFRGQSS